MKKVDEKMYYLNKEDIFEFLKNRPPLLMIDDVYVEPGRKAYTKKKMDAGAWYFECHFPGAPMMPGVLQLETIFNTAAMPVKLLEGYKKKTTNVVQVNYVNFKRHILPEEVIYVYAEIIKFRRGIAKARGIISVGDEMCCETEFLLAVLDDVIIVQDGE